MYNFRFINKMSVGLVLISTDGDKSIWDRSKIRRPRACAKCERELHAGDAAYAPMTNRTYRYLRLCVACVEELAQPKG